jgi:hypothetical protein
MEYKIANAHRMVAHLAEEMAGATYEELARNNAFYAANPDRSHAIKVIAPTLIPAARQTLTEMLLRHDVSDHEKAAIHEALVLDNSIPKPGRRTVTDLPRTSGVVIPPPSKKH